MTIPLLDISRPRLTDRSRLVVDWMCPRKRLLAYDYDGRGLVNPHTSLELFEGTTVHDALATIARQQQMDGSVDIDYIASTSAAQTREGLLSQSDMPNDPEVGTWAHEQGALVEGLIRGFYRHTWPRLLAAYPTIKWVEQEMTYRLADDVTFMSRPDLVMEAADGTLWYIEYKTTSTKKPSWMASWSTAVQLHSSIKAIEQTHGVHMTGVIVQGLYKGYESYGRQNSPMCYGFVRPGSPPFVAEQVRYDYAAGWQRQPTWLRPGGVRAWVDAMPDAILGDQFPQAPPIFVNHDLVDRFFAQVLVREREVAAALRELDTIDNELDQQTVLNKAFPQHFDQCHSAWGRPCTFQRICHGGAGSDPLVNGYQYRLPHHDAELERVADALDSQ